MARNLVEKVMWVGRATVFAVGLVAIFALLLGVAYVAFSTLSGNADQRDVIPPQVGIDAGMDQTLSLDPLAVRRMPTRGFARVSIAGQVDPARSKEVKDVVIPEGQTNVYCFDLTFRPKVAVGSPFIANAADIATSTYPDDGISPRDDVCPDGYRDLAVKTYGSSGTAEAVNFDIVFMR
jgi:hypothetical protein